MQRKKLESNKSASSTESKITTQSHEQQFIECPDTILNTTDIILGKKTFPQGQFAVSARGVIAINDKINPEFIKLYVNGLPVAHFRIASKVCSKIAWMNDSTLVVSDDVALFKYDIHGKLLGKLEFASSNLTIQYANQKPKKVEFGSGNVQSKTAQDPVSDMLAFSNDIIITTHGRSILKSDFKSKKVVVLVGQTIAITKLNEHAFVSFNPRAGAVADFRQYDAASGDVTKACDGIKFNGAFPCYFNTLSENKVAGCNKGRLFIFDLESKKLDWYKNDERLNYIVNVCALSNNIFAILSADFETRDSQVAHQYTLSLYNLKNYRLLSKIVIDKSPALLAFLDYNPVTMEIVLVTQNETNMKDGVKLTSRSLRTINIGLKEYFAHVENTRSYLDSNFRQFSLFANPLVEIVKGYLNLENETQDFKI